MRRAIWMSLAWIVTRLAWMASGDDSDDSDDDSNDDDDPESNEPPAKRVTRHSQGLAKTPDARSSRRQTRSRD